ncbi:hypothetical protein H9X85_00105 [Anaerotignum lactatifermentans]|uniref:Uncharacterized protein n=1 Tax=Anaerotignum lactatifermentans TaxID=160404 RepID=A0ABS2G825_9FIRM|nr:hypothetical protein [Anaerotignum lactatifermentans]MBM6828029.1 hypothetical protein [Anaerotignum lactatifermentans]MBM6876808.1 hypothetical protein [Anaerotignum lactatifermentans]MBM6949612.1 hypothetical protein [Anaerotignum lactatifermentans]
MILNGEGVPPDHLLAVIEAGIPREADLLPTETTMRHLIQTLESEEENRNADGRVS